MKRDWAKIFSVDTHYLVALTPEGDRVLVTRRFVPDAEPGDIISYKKFLARNISGVSVCKFYARDPVVIAKRWFAPVNHHTRPLVSAEQFKGFQERNRDYEETHKATA